MNKKLIELNRKYWNEIIPMAEKYNIDPSTLVRVKDLITDKIITELVPNCGVTGVFDNYVNHRHARIEFAKIVIENKPVFFLDELYDKSGRKVRFGNLMLVFPDAANAAIESALLVGVNDGVDVDCEPAGVGVEATTAAGIVELLLTLVPVTAVGVLTIAFGAAVCGAAVSAGACPAATAGWAAGSACPCVSASTA
jgi:hypothetical protein